MVLCFLCQSASLTIGSNLLSVGGSQPLNECKKGNTDLTPQSLGWPCSTNLGFSTNWIPVPSDPPRGNYTVGSPRRTDTSSHCPDTQTGLPHYNRCSWELPAQTWPAGTLAVWPEDLREGQQQNITRKGHMDESRGSCDYFSYCRKSVHMAVVHWMCNSLKAGTHLLCFPFCHAWHTLGVTCNMLRFTISFIFFYFTVLLLLFWIITVLDLLQDSASMHGKKKKQEEWLRLNSFWHSHAAVIGLPENRHCDNSIRN